MQWLDKTIQYPATAQGQGIQGLVVVHFLIAADGSVKDATIVQSSNQVDFRKLKLREAKQRSNPGSCLFWFASFRSQ
ncbi:MAG: energy transducer TonB [Dysgonamonadaceae bacterium]|jgi:protein TonB|nr:energy transducer TonB [Dysgonamonadaceae bacterium]